MYGRSDGCLLILLSVGVAFLLTLTLMFAVLVVLLCVAAWVFAFGVIVAEAIHDQRRPRR